MTAVRILAAGLVVYGLAAAVSAQDTARGLPESAGAERGEGEVPRLP